MLQVFPRITDWRPKSAKCASHVPAIDGSSYSLPGVRWPRSTVLRSMILAVKVSCKRHRCEVSLMGNMHLGQGERNLGLDQTNCSAMCQFCALLDSVLHQATPGNTAQLLHKGTVLPVNGGSEGEAAAVSEFQTQCPSMDRHIPGNTLQCAQGVSEIRKSPSQYSGGTQTSALSTLSKPAPELWMPQESPSWM